MTVTEICLVFIAVLLFFIFLKVDDMASRFKQRFPTPKEEDSAWAKIDPIGHWDAHKNDKKR